MVVAKRDLALIVGTVLLLATAVVRIATPDRSRLRPLSVEAVHFDPETIDPGQTVTRELQWTPPTDVYVMGWRPWVAIPANRRHNVELALNQGRTALLYAAQSVDPPGVVDPWDPQSFPPGTGFVVSRATPLTVRLRVSNTGTEPLPTGGATTLLYFVPYAGN
jgi:hypothetical protein